MKRKTEHPCDGVEWLLFKTYPLDGKVGSVHNIAPSSPVLAVTYLKNRKQRNYTNRKNARVRAHLVPTLVFLEVTYTQLGKLTSETPRQV